MSAPSFSSVENVTRMTVSFFPVGVTVGVKIFGPVKSNFTLPLSVNVSDSFPALSVSVTLTAFSSSVSPPLTA